MARANLADVADWLEASRWTRLDEWVDANCEGIDPLGHNS